MFVDELDILLAGSKDVRHSFLSTLRQLKHITSSPLHSFVGIGVFHINQLAESTNEFVSPFNVKESLELDHFTWEQHCQLFEDYQQEYQLKLPQELVKDIYALVKG